MPCFLEDKAEDEEVTFDHRIVNREAQVVLSEVRAVVDP